MKRPDDVMDGMVRVAVLFWCVAFLVFPPGCAPPITVNKSVTVLALPHAAVNVEMNSTTDASGNTQSPHVAPQLDLDLAPMNWPGLQQAHSEGFIP